MYLKGIFLDGKPQKKWTFEFLLVPKFKFTTVCLVSQLADFAIGGIFSGPKISQFRELTVICIGLLQKNCTIIFYLIQNESFLGKLGSYFLNGPTFVQKDKIDLIKVIAITYSIPPNV